MITYSIIMFLTATLFGVIGVAIYRGKTNLIHDYHQTNVTDKAAYGKSFGKAMFIISTALFLKLPDNSCCCKWKLVLTD